MNTIKRRYPVGIQTFEKIIKGGYVYVDKTDLVWRLTQLSNYVFLSRPRRFGKSLLSSTLRSFFEGRKDLFEGLKVMELEQEWKEYPVIHLDLSLAKGKDSAEELRRTLLLMLSRNQFFEGNPAEKTPGEKLNGMIQRAYQQTHSQVVVIIDEYDAPLLEVLHEEENLPQYRKVMQEFYVPLKACDPYLRFCFITGITKFSQLSIFSTINNLKNVSMRPDFSAICGITENEVKTDFAEDIKHMAELFDCSPEEMFQKIKQMYDGYHFARVSEDIYNPFSLLNAFDDGELNSSWFASATPSYLIHQMQHFRTDITAMDNLEEPAESFDIPTEAMTTALPLLYQSGYLTIKGYDANSMMYSLSIPNHEVRLGFTKGLLPTYIGLEAGGVQSGFAVKFWRALKQDDLDLALREMQAYLAGIPYVEGFKKKLEEAATAEGFYEYTFYLIFSMLNVYVRTQVKCAGGRTDVVVLMPDTTYVLELKTNGSAQSALDQINQKGYAVPYQADHHVVKAGIHFNADTRTIDDWVIE
ncbi:MAG: AAA family ATPase [Prevotella sp.]|nr:AAA family ATPase [Prevotella sp.]